MKKRRDLLNIRLAVCLILGGLIITPGLNSGEKTASAAELTPVEVVAGETHETAGAAIKEAELSAFDAVAWTKTAMGSVDARVFDLALSAAEAAVARGEAEPSTLTVIDFSQPSTTERMWVYDLRTRQLLFSELVSHGRNSGHNMATSFSNQPESNKSSIGLYRTAEGYIGQHGYSLRLDGLEPGFNDRARQRAIVIHGAEYVNGSTAKAQGRLGRSLGCPAVRPDISRQLIDAVKGSGLVFAYYPDPEWLGTSRYLN